MRAPTRFPPTAYIVAAALFAVLLLALAALPLTDSQAAAGDTTTTAATADAAEATPPAAPPKPTHRPLRDNRPPDLPPPTEPAVFAGYPGVPAFTVVPRQEHLALYPCSQCHAVLPTNPEPRKLTAAPHAAALEHGGGRMWCLDCHTAADRDTLRSIDNRRISFNDSAALCGQCHGERHRDWHFGGHGKRVGNWTGERQIYACTHCHDPHRPALAPREPSPPPHVRAGLTQPAPHDAVHLPLLQRLEQGAQDARPPAR